MSRRESLHRLHFRQRCASMLVTGILLVMAGCGSGPLYTPTGNQGFVPGTQPEAPHPPAVTAREIATITVLGSLTKPGAVIGDADPAATAFALPAEAVQPGVVQVIAIQAADDVGNHLQEHVFIEVSP